MLLLFNCWMFDAAVEEKMSVSCLIKAVTLTRDHGIEVGSSASEAQCPGVELGR